MCSCNPYAWNPGLARDLCPLHGVGTSAVVDSAKPFKVRASCGHIDIRKMREAPEVILDAPNGRACEECEKVTTQRLMEVLNPSSKEGLLG